MSKQFTTAEQIVKKLPPTGKVSPSQDQKLQVSRPLVLKSGNPGLTFTADDQFYSLFKQAKEGDVNVPRPGEWCPVTHAH
jgi:hypothetical protein